MSAAPAIATAPPTEDPEAVRTTVDAMPAGAADPVTAAPPRLQVIHSAEPLASLPVAAAQRVHQCELPLHWAADRHGESAAARLAAYPQLPLDPGTPRPEPFVAHAATLIADVLAGARPATQLARCASLDLQHRLTRRCALRAAQQPWNGRQARISSTSTMVVSGTAVQIVVVFFIGRRAHGAAIRMEYRHGRWLVTDVQSPA